MARHTGQPSRYCPLHTTQISIASTRPTPQPTQLRLLLRAAPHRLRLKYLHLSAHRIHVSRRQYRWPLAFSPSFLSRGVGSFRYWANGTSLPIPSSLSRSRRVLLSGRYPTRHRPAPHDIPYGLILLQDFAPLLSVNQLEAALDGVTPELLRDISLDVIATLKPGLHQFALQKGGGASRVRVRIAEGCNCVLTAAVGCADGEALGDKAGPVGVQARALVDRTARALSSLAPPTPSWPPGIII